MLPLLQFLVYKNHKPCLSGSKITQRCVADGTLCPPLCSQFPPLQIGGNYAHLQHRHSPLGAWVLSLSFQSSSFNYASSRAYRFSWHAIFDDSALWIYASSCVPQIRFLSHWNLTNSNWRNHWMEQVRLALPNVHALPLMLFPDNCSS
jgi:hypothetical protein